MLTITAPEGKELPATASVTPGTQVVVTVNGAATTGFAYARTTGNTREAKITFNAAGMNNANDIYVNFTGALDAPTEKTVNITYKTGSALSDGVTVAPTKVIQGNYLPTLTLTNSNTGYLMEVTKVTCANATVPTADYEVDGNEITFSEKASTLVDTNGVSIEVDLYQNVDVIIAGAGADNVTCTTTQVRKGSNLTALPLVAKTGYVIDTVAISDGTTDVADGNITKNAANITFTLNDVAGNVTVTVTTKVAAKVELTSDSVGVTISAPTGGNTTVGTALANNLTIVLDASHSTWSLPKTVEVTISLPLERMSLPPSLAT